MNPNDSGNLAPGNFRARVTDVALWFYRRRHIAALNVLRGASYAAGTSAVGLVVFWIESRH